MAHKHKEPRQPWTNSEDEILHEELSKYPGNLQLAFEQTATRLHNRTQGSVSGHYYTVVKKSNRKIMALATNRGIMVNTKMTQRPPELSRAALSRMDVAKTAVDEMTLDEKKLLLKYMMKQQ